MSTAYIHVLLNHIPVIGTMIGLVYLVVGLLFRNKSIVNGALAMFVVMALVAVPTFLTGEPAEEILENTAGFSLQTAHEHEEAADLALIISIIMGVIALIALVMKKFSRLNQNWLMVLVLIAALATSFLMARTAHLGGQIRRPELRNESIQPQNENIEPSGQDH